MTGGFIYLLKLISNIPLVIFIFCRLFLLNLLRSTGLLCLGSLLCFLCLSCLIGCLTLFLYIDLFPLIIIVSIISLCCFCICLSQQVSIELSRLLRCSLDTSLLALFKELWSCLTFIREGLWLWVSSTESIWATSR